MGAEPGLPPCRVVNAATPVREQASPASSIVAAAKATAARIWGRFAWRPANRAEHDGVLRSSVSTPGVRPAVAAAERRPAARAPHPDRGGGARAGTGPAPSSCRQRGVAAVSAAAGGAVIPRLYAMNASMSAVWAMRLSVGM